MEPRKPLPVIELFGPTIQGEGAMCGAVSHFVRLGGCTYRCSWCDSMHAVDPQQVKQNRKMMTPMQITDELYDRARNIFVTLTGGDPLMHDCSELVANLNSANFRVAVETQGAFYKDWIEDCYHVTVSPKPPSSGETPDMAVLERYYELFEKNLENETEYPSVCLKVVVFNQDDYMWARNLHRRWPDIPFYLSVGTILAHEKSRDQICEALRVLGETVCADPEMHDVTVLPQLHALMWGQEKGR